jgi:hypothetical protein
MTRSAQELRLASEQSRVELAATVEKLRVRVADTAEDIRDRVSPEHIKSELSYLVRDKTSDWIHGLKQQAQEHPMQVVAAGAAIAVPLLRLARGFPLPLLMIGAGLVLSSKTVRDRAKETAAPALEKAGDILDQAAERSRAVQRRVQDGFLSVQTHAAGIGDDLAEGARSQATRASRIVEEGIRAGVEVASNVAAGAPTKARHVIGDNAALIGGLGIAVGAIVAAAFPASKIEAKAVGSASDSLKRAAGEAAQSGFETARDATMSALAAAATKIDEADLGSNASQITREVSRAFSDAVDDVERTAFSTSPNSNV